jgi:signal transduction histidine kinase
MAAAGENEPIRREIGALASEVAGVIEDLREISAGIHPAILSHGGLAAAVRMLVRRSTVPVQADIRVDRQLPSAVEVCSYYVVSELLTNMAKHANASFAGVKIDTHGQLLRIVVSDDGVGGAAPQRGSGLIGISDRVHALGGTVAVSSETGSGTRICCEFPLSTIDALPSVQ